MKRYFTLSILMLFCAAISLRAQMSPNDAIKALGRGINMGNTLEPPDGEGTWGNPPAAASNFDDYKNAGFNSVRLPITWDLHTDASPPYTIDPTWLNRIEQIVDWGLSRHLIIIVNAQHESWLKADYSDANKARFDSIWSQIAARLQNKSDSLFFEVINEPYPLSASNVDDLNARIIQIIRITNPNRIVLFSGSNYSNSAELIAAAVPQDNFIIGYYHSYDPYPFGLNGPGTYGSVADINATTQKFDQVTAWSAQTNVPVVLSEYGYTYKCDYNSRMCAYATVAQQAQLHNIPFMAWEDGGDFKFYNRTRDMWSEIKDVIIHTYKESPNQMKISTVSDTLIQIQWKNRTTQIDSFVIERKIDTNSFAFFAKLAPSDSVFIDSTTSRGKEFFYRLRANLKNSNLIDSVEIQSYPIMLNIPGTVRAPYLAAPVSIPGKVECENYDIGGEGLTYHDVDEINMGGFYRNDGVDIGEITPGQYYVGWVAASEWLEYTINVQQAGTYNVSVNYAAQNASALTLKFPSTHSPVPLTLPATGGESIYSSASKSIALNAGVQVMHLAINSSNNFNMDNITFSPVTSVNTENVPLHFELSNNYPNPFNPATTFAFQIAQRSNVILKIYDIIGREVATIVSGVMEPGKYTRQWNAATFSSGVYFYRLQAGSFIAVKKLILLK